MEVDRSEGYRREGGAREGGGSECDGKEVKGAQYSQETGGKGDVLMSEREMDNRLIGEMIAGHNATEESNAAATPC